jgi:hypothetical protein
MRAAPALALLLAACKTTIAPGAGLVVNPKCLAVCRVNVETALEKLASQLKQCPKEKDNAGPALP